MKKDRSGKYGKSNKRTQVNPIPDLGRLVSIASSARLHGDDKVFGLLRAAQLTQDPGLARHAAEYIGKRAMDYMMNPDPFAPPVDPEDARGDVEIGMIENSQCMFGIRLDEMPRHVLLVGASGSGKTTLIKKIVKEILSKE